MTLFFLLLEATQFHQAVRPALADAWRLRSFAPCRALCAALEPAAFAFQQRYNRAEDEPLLCKVAHGLGFHRDFWTMLAGEVLLYGAAEIAEVDADPDTLCCLLAGAPWDDALPRERFAPIHQALYGARDLSFGGKLYQPHRTGWNDRVDVARLADYLAAVRTEAWTADALRALPTLTDDAERAEELELARDWFPSLPVLYDYARRQDYVIARELP